MDFRRAVGVLIFIGAVQFIIGMHLAEFLYPGYSVSGNYKRPGCNVPPRGVHNTVAFCFYL